MVRFWRKHSQTLARTLALARCFCSAAAPNITGRSAQTLLLPAYQQPSSQRINSPTFVPQAISLRLDCVSFEHQILNENLNLRVHWAKFQRLLDAGVTEADIKKSLKLHPHPLSRISDQHLDSVLRVLNGVGMSGKGLGKVLLTYSRLFRLSAKNLEGKIKVFESFGVARTNFKVPFVLPFVCCLSVKSLADRIQYLIDIGIKREDIAKIVSRNPRVFHLSMENKVKPTITYLKECGMEQNILCRCISSSPQILGYGNHARSRRVQFFRQLGLEEKSLRSARAFVLLSSVSLIYLQKGVDFLRSRGFSSTQIASMVGKFPPILSLSEENLSKKIDYVQNVLKRDIRELVKCPTFFGFNLDKRIISRFSALAECKEANLHISDYSLGTVVKHSEDGFRKWLLRHISRKRTLGEI